MEEEKKVEVLEEKKKNNGLGPGFMVILVVLFLVGGVLGFAASKILDEPVKKDNTEEKETKKDKKEKEEKVTFSDEELKKYVEYIGSTSLSTVDAKLYNVSSVNASKLSAREKIEYIGSYLLYSKQVQTTEDYKYMILSEAEVKTTVEKVYGPNTYERTTFNLGCGDFTFRDNEEKYYSPTGCGGTSAVTARNTIIDYTATKSKLEITTAYVFADGMTNKLYKDYEMKNALGDIETTDNFDAYLTNYVKENKDKLHHIVYTFESKDGRNYYFTGFKNNK